MVWLKVLFDVFTNISLCWDWLAGRIQNPRAVIGAPPLLVMLPVRATEVLVVLPRDRVTDGALTTGAAPAWVTATLRVVAPGADTVIVPKRWVVAVLAVVLIVKEPLLEPLPGVTVSQDVALLVAFQLALEVTEIVWLLTAWDGFHDDWDMFRVGAWGAPGVTNLCSGLL